MWVAKTNLNTNNQTYKTNLNINEKGWITAWDSVSLNLPEVSRYFFNCQEYDMAKWTQRYGKKIMGTVLAIYL